MADPEPLPVPALPAGPPSRVLGSLGEFDPKAEGISSYLERVQLYFEANSVEDDRKVPVLLTVVGAKTYETLRSLLAPTRAREKSFIDLIEVLKRHFDPQPLVIGFLSTIAEVERNDRRLRCGPSPTQRIWRLPRPSAT